MRATDIACDVKLFYAEIVQNSMISKFQKINYKIQALLNYSTYTASVLAFRAIENQI